ncbi:MAG: stage III sporulation protein AF [Lachnospiraceae bacterium]|nr:stage III sporulation protein AF [Lachnospiraceae bacterium]
MGYVFTWVKNLVCFYLLLTVVLHLLPRQSYRKYVRFFSGMLLTILVVSPVLSLLGNEEALREKISQAEFFQDLDNHKLDTEHLETTQKEIYLREYERALEMDVSRMAQEKQLAAREVKVRLTEGYEVESIEIAVAMEKDDDNIFVQETPAASDSSRDTKISELRQDLAEYYRLNEEQVSIVVL